MTPKLTDDMRRALDHKPGGPIEVEDDQTHRVYVLVAREAFSKLIDEALRQALQIGFDQSDRGESELWEVESFLAAAERKLAQQSA